MPMASYRTAPQETAQARRRGMAFALAVIVHLLLLWVLLHLPPEIFQRPPQKALPTTFEMLPGTQEAAPPAPKKQQVAKAASSSSAASHHSTTPQPVPSPEPVPPPPPVPVRPTTPMLAGGDLFDAGDISKLGHHDGEGDDEGASGNGSGKDSASVYGPGEGPGGQRLYNAEWYREPGRAVLANYLSGAVPPGSWATVACRTIEDYHVDNCRSLDESPPGSGLARALRQAAWQFLVRPPRLGGKPLIGAWVRIRFDITPNGDASTR